MLDLDKVYQASQVLEGQVRKTDLIYSKHLSQKNEIYLKTENLQRTGSFKVRGAHFRLSQLSEEEASRGVVACSAGNHAQGVALAAQKMGIQAEIFLPASAPISKVEATRAMGASIHLIDGVYDDAYEAAMAFCQEKNAIFVHPFDDEDVIAGQATIALEILEDLPDVDAVIVPVGGGGLISGIGYALKSIRPSCKVYGVEAEKASAMSQSLVNGILSPTDSVHTFADGIAVKCPGDLTFGMCQSFVDGMFTVTEDQIATAILALMEKEKLVAEGAGAVGVASLLFDLIPEEGKKIAVIISGGNIDVNILNRVVERGLLTSGRRTNLVVELIDMPGQLEKVAHLVAKTGGNVTGVHYSPGGRNMAIDGIFLDLTIETKNFDHILEIENTLSQAGLTIVESIH